MDKDILKWKYVTSLQNYCTNWHAVFFKKVQKCFEKHDIYQKGGLISSDLKKHGFPLRSSTFVIFDRNLRMFSDVRALLMIVWIIITLIQSQKWVFK